MSAPEKRYKIPQGVKITHLALIGDRGYCLSGKVDRFFFSTAGLLPPQYRSLEDNEVYGSDKGTNEMHKVHEFEGHRVLSIDTKGNFLGGVIGNVQNTFLSSSHESLLAGLPKWNTELHKTYPTPFKTAVKTLLMIHSRDSQHQPRHPECLIWRVPIELIMRIIHFVALSGVLSSQNYTQ